MATFAPYHGISVDDMDDKDASVFPVAVPNPSSHLELAILHRPLFPGTRPEETCRPASRALDLDRESIWISYCPMNAGEMWTRLFWRVQLASPVGDTGVSMGTVENRRGHPAHPDAARLVDHLSWGPRSG